MIDTTGASELNKIMADRMDVLLSDVKWNETKSRRCISDNR